MSEGLPHNHAETGPGQFQQYEVVDFTQFRFVTPEKGKEFLQHAKDALVHQGVSRREAELATREFPREIVKDAHGKLFALFDLDEDEAFYEVPFPDSGPDTWQWIN